MSNGLLLFYTTVETKVEAHDLAKVLIESRFVACVNIIDRVESFYRWEGRVNCSSEVIVLIKTIDIHFDKVNELICKHHKYSVPCVLSLSVSSHNDDYNEWIAELFSAK